jgi:hypothetical protein
MMPLPQPREPPSVVVALPFFDASSVGERPKAHQRWIDDEHLACQRLARFASFASMAMVQTAVVVV